VLKKIVMVSAILAVSSSVVLASGSPYIGLNVGGNNVDDKYTSSEGEVAHFAANTLLGGLFGGYGGIVSPNVYLGGEVFVNFSQKASINEDDGFNETDQNNYNYGIAFIPGYMLGDHTMVYAKLGVERGRFTFVVNAAPTTKSTAGGLLVGLGLQAALTANVDLRGEYVYNKYKDISTQSSAGPTKDSMTSGVYTIGLVYKFG
jgi:outer membrane immunogenic protein